MGLIGARESLSQDSVQRATVLRAECCVKQVRRQDHVAPIGSSMRPMAVPEIEVYASACDPLSG